MTKKTTTIICVLLSTIFCTLNAQDFNNVKISYSQIIKYNNQDSIKIAKEFRQQYIQALLEKKYYELIVEGKKSKYSENIKLNNEQNNSMFKINSTQSKVYKDFENQKIIYEMNFPNKTFVSDSLKEIKWEIQQKADTLILDYNSFIAKTEMDGQKIEAYFTYQIPIPDGPDKFYGLPGLILKLEVANKNGNEVQVFQVEEINHLEKKVDIKFPDKKIISSEEYDKIIQNFLEKQKEYNSNSFD